MNGDFEAGGWVVCPKLNAAIRRDASRRLSPKSMKLLVFLAERQGDVVSKDEILAAVWAETFVTDDALTRCIVELRRVFEDEARQPHFIQTISKKGYRLVAPVRWLAADAARQPNGDRIATIDGGLPGGSVVANGQGPLPSAPSAGHAGELSVSAAESALATADPLASRGVSSRTIILAALVALIAGGAIGAGVMAQLRQARGAPIVASAIKLEPGEALSGTNWLTGVPTRTAMAVSSDGKFVVYCAKNDGTGKTRLFLREMNKGQATIIAGTEGGEWPFLDPDNQWLGFVADGQLKKVRIAGGPATILVSGMNAPFGASWGSDGYIAFARGFGTGLLRIRSEGGIQEIATMLSAREYGHRLPHCLPAGKGVLYTIYALPMDPHPTVAVLDSSTRRTHALLDDAADARYVPTGHLVFLRQGSLMAAPFDLDRLQVTGQPVPVGIGVVQALNTGSSFPHETAAGQFSISDSGSLAYVAGGIAPDQQKQLVWVEQDGREAGDALPFTAPFLAARVSPDGTSIAYTVIGMNKDVRIYDLRRGATSTVTNDGRANFAIWSADGKRLVFGWSKSGPPNLFVQPVDHSAPPEALTADQGYSGQGPGSWAPDGNLLAFWRQLTDGTDQILTLNQTTGVVTVLVQGRAGERLFHPEFSRDGRWLAYTSLTAGSRNVFVRAYPRGGTWQISASGGTEPLWSKDGKRLFYRWNGAVWAVDIDSIPTFVVGKPRVLFAHADVYFSSAPGRAWDLSADGRRFLMVKVEDIKPQPVTELVLVQNWTDALQRLARGQRP